MRSSIILILAAGLLLSAGFALGFAIGTRRELRTEKVADRCRDASGCEWAAPERSMVSIEADWAKRWSGFRGRLTASAREEEAMAFLRGWAAHAPLEALAAAEAEQNPHRRQRLIGAALRGWAALDAVTAGNWMREHLRVDDRQALAADWVAGARAAADGGVASIRRLCDADPAVSAEYGRAFVMELTHDGEFEQAVAFASSASPESRSYWLDTAFSQWAEQAPRDAIAALATVDDPAVRRELLPAVVNGWASIDPVGLAEFARSLPAGIERDAAFDRALQEWVYRDPESIMKWIDTQPPSRDLDGGMMAVATLPALLQQPEVALDWASYIVDDERRRRTQLGLVRQWAARDLAAAQRYVDGLSDDRSDRTALRAELQRIGAKSAHRPNG